MRIKHKPRAAPGRPHGREDTGRGGVATSSDAAAGTRGEDDVDDGATRSRSTRRTRARVASDERVSGIGTGERVDVRPVVVLAIDPATRSGWAIVHADTGQLLHFGTCTKRQGGIGKVIEKAVHIAGLIGARLDAVREVWSPHGWQGTALYACATAGGWWEAMAAAVGVEMTEVLTDTWRARVLGKGGQRSTKQWDAAACAYVKARWGVDVNRDEAAACCIAAWYVAHRRATVARSTD